MTKLLTFIILTIGCSFGFSQTLKDDITEKQPYTLFEKNIVFVGHATAFWDQSRKTEAATRNVIRLGREYQMPVVATVAHHMMGDPYNAQLHYFGQSDIDLLISSRAGGHRLLLPSVKNIFIVGGNLNRCLCEGVRDLAYGFVKAEEFKEVNMYLIVDGIYAAYAPYSPIRDETIALDFSKRFFGPAFNCPLQNWGRANEKPMIMSDTLISVYYHQKHLGDIDLEPGDGVSLSELKKKINIHYISSDEVESIVKQLK